MQATPATIRIYPEYQLSSSLSASAQATIKAVVTSAIATLQGYLQVQRGVEVGRVRVRAVEKLHPVAEVGGQSVRGGAQDGEDRYRVPAVKQPTRERTGDDQGSGDLSHRGGGG